MHLSRYSCNTVYLLMMPKSFSGLALSPVSRPVFTILATDISQSIMYLKLNSFSPILLPTLYLQTLPIVA